MKAKPRASGFGKEIPPSKLHVIAWFLQKGASEETACAFYQFYSDLNWRNANGLPMRDWKMRAWDWLWR